MYFPCAVVEFAKKTGDLRELSRTDLLVLALTYMLDVEANGAGRLRTEPVGIPLSMLDIIDEPEEKDAATPSAGEAAAAEAGPAVDEAGDDGEGEPDAAASAEDDWIEVHHSKPKPLSKSQRKRRNKAAAKAAAAAEGLLPAPSSAPSSTPTAAPALLPPSSPIATSADAAVSAMESLVLDPTEDDGEGVWVGPDTFSKGMGSSTQQLDPAAPAPTVGCITTDFAMQVRPCRVRLSELVSSSCTGAFECCRVLYLQLVCLARSLLK